MACEERHSYKNEDNLVKEAIDRAADSCIADEPLMTPLCRISAEVDKAKKQAKVKGKQRNRRKRRKSQEKAEKGRRRIRGTHTKSSSPEESSRTVALM